MESPNRIRVAILDLYQGHPNQGMRCIREILADYARHHDLHLEYDEFDVRLKQQVPDLSYDLYISSGGPGSPLDSKDSDWEKAYFGWLSQVEAYNNNPSSPFRKPILLICHSFQLVCRQLGVALVTHRKSTAFGTFPVHMVDDAQNDPLFIGLQDPFYAVDSRSYQVIQPDKEKISAMGGHILAIEKERPHIPLERALMALRFNDYMVGTQFHPEADAVGMSMYFQQEDRKHTVISEYGEEKWKNMIAQLDDPDKIRWTYSHVIPNFLDDAMNYIPAGHALHPQA